MGVNPINKGMDYFMETLEKSELQRKNIEVDYLIEEDALNPLEKKMKLDLESKYETRYEK
jgi:hypothetical protein